MPRPQDQLKPEIGCLDRDSEQYQRELQRPAAIKEDLWEMARRRRVAQVLGAQDFCSELEQIIRSDFAKSFPEELNSSAIQQTATLPSHHLLPPLPRLNVNQILNTSPVPIADLSVDRYSREERMCRNKLATLYRLVDLFHWSQGIYNHITLRLPHSDPPEILINPFGLLYHEITASSLIKLTLEGSVLDQGTTNLGVNQAGYVLHSAIHEARPDVHCVLHLHTAVVSAVGAMKCGLLPLCQEAMIIGPVAYHDYQGILTDEEEKKSIVRDLGDKNVLILRNHGFVVCGQSVEDALHLAFHTIIACETQIRAARAGIDNLLVPTQEAALKAYQTARRGAGGVNRLANGTANGHSNGIPEKPNHSWGIGELEWEAWCRVLDMAGFCTGHEYRQPQLCQPQHPTVSHCYQSKSMHNLSSVASPSNGPSSYGAISESEAGAGMGSHRLAALRSRARWLSSPNQYQRVQQLESGTDAPRVITRWVQQWNGGGGTSASCNGTPVKINSPHQFSATSCTNPREFRDRRSRMKEVRMCGTISPGPRSQVLDTGITLANVEEGRSRARTREGALYIGTASKGIIERDQQYNAQVYRRLYAPNPFKAEEEGRQEMKQYADRDGASGGVQKSISTPAIVTMDAEDAEEALPEQQSPALDAASLMQAVRRPMNGHAAKCRSASTEADGGGAEAGEEQYTAPGGIVKSWTETEMGPEAMAEGKKAKKKRWMHGGRSIFASLMRRKRK